MAPPTLSLPPSSTGALPPIPNELYLALHRKLSQTPGESDGLDTFVLGGAGDGHGDSAVGLEDILNELIPSESSLDNSELIALLLRAKIHEIRLQIESLTVQLQEDQSPARMSEIQELIGDLLSQVTAIRDAATESEVVVREITRDIQSLDLAKKNLIASMNALKRFQMLVNAFEQLTRLAKSRRYAETAQALGAVKQLSQYFKTFSSVERIAAVSRGVNQVQEVLRGQVMREFDEAFKDENKRRANLSTLADACLVLDALGPSSRESLLSTLTLTTLKDYRRIFSSPSSEAGALDNVSRRFAWFRRAQKGFEEEWSLGIGMTGKSVWLEEWNVGAVLVGGFSECTREDLKSVLAKESGSLTVSLLLEALQATKEFESEMSRKYNMSFESISLLSPINFSKTGQKPDQKLSAVYEPYLGVFVDAQDRVLAEMFQQFLSSRVSISPTDNPSSVLPSSTELFYFYRDTLEKCAKLSVKQPLLDLCKVYKKWLKVYAEEVLSGALVRPDPSRRSSGDSRLNERELQTACLVLNTAEYCQETASQLEDRLRSLIDPTFRPSISLDSERDLFLKTISTSLLSILHELELTLEPAFTSMVQGRWKEVEFVSSESRWVGELVSGMSKVLGLVREGVEQKKYVRTVCDKVIGVVLAKLTSTLVRCRPIPQTGAEQVLLDLQGVKSALLHLLLAPGDPAPIPTSYSRLVTKSVQKLDTLLKVIMHPEEPAEEFIKHYLLLIPCQSFSDFQKVLDLKGVKRVEQNNLLDLFLSKTSTYPTLSDSSFLTSLDMDPPTSGTLVSGPTGASSTLSSGLNSPSMSHSNLGLFNINTSLTSTAASREGSRSGTPVMGPGRANEGGERGERGERGKEALQEFKRFGARIGMASRLFGGDRS